MKPASEVFNRARADTPGGTTVDEHDWLTCVNPEPMLRHLGPGMSARKIRLWSESVYELCRSDSHLAYEWMLSQNPWSTNPRTFCESIPEPFRLSAACLLRCIFGNPLRPIRPVIHGIQTDSAVYVEGDTLMRAIDDCWLTPAAISLARAIHADRDWAALPVLADLLETEGCPAEAVCSANCERTVGPKGESKEFYVYEDCGPESRWVKCRDCGGTGRVPNPLLAHLRSGGPHALGCHALEAILGRTTP